MALHPFRCDLSLLEEHYSRLVQEHGDTPEGVQWSDRQSQEHRVAILTEVGDLRSAKVLDFGCGTGHLLAFMRDRLGFTGEYVGYDLSAGMIATAQGKFPGIRFEQRDVLADGVPEEFDFVLVNGVFNNRVHNNWGLLTTILLCLFSHTRTALAFNALSTYVDFFDPKLFYVNPEDVFRFCKERLSPCVILRHDYLIKPGTIPFEFSVYLYKTEVKPRKELSM
jgi:SAM-dependent methyltransferase